MSDLDLVWRRPMVARDVEEPHRVSTPLELFFDLCFVVAVAAAAAELHHSEAEPGHLATLAGAAGANALGDPKLWGLDAAIPAGFIALVWPRLNDRRSWAIGLCAAAVALVLTPFLRPGVPVLLTSVVAVVAGVLAVRTKAES